MSNTLPSDHKGSMVLSRKIIRESQQNSLTREKLARAAIGRTE